jgi:hypothetical protein
MKRTASVVIDAPPDAKKAALATRGLFQMLRGGAERDRTVGLLNAINCRAKRFSTVM